MGERHDHNAQQLLEQPPGDPDLKRHQRFRALYEEHYARTVSYLRHLGLSRDESRDLAQDVFLRVYRGLAEYRGEAPEGAWIRRIARNLFLNAMRDGETQKRKGQEVPIDGTGADASWGGSGVAVTIAAREDDSPLEVALDRERAHRLSEALAELPPRMRQCVLLRLNQGLKYEQIARLQGVTVSTVKVQLFQARGLLRQRLREVFEAQDLDPLEKRPRGGP